MSGVNNLAKLGHRIKGISKGEINTFRMEICFKLFLASFAGLLTTVFSFYILVRINLNYFESQGLLQTVQTEEAFYDFVLNKLLYFGPYAGIYLIATFFLGSYVTSLLTRPFRVIGEYSKKSIVEKKVSYDPEFLTNLKLLTHFAEFFFNQIENMKNSGEFHPVKSPEKYNKIKKPVWAWGFFLQFSFFILLSSIIGGLGVYFLSQDLQSSLIEFSSQFLKGNKGIIHFFIKQEEVLLIIVWVIIWANTFFHFLFSMNLYRQVSAPAFAYFITMRAFLRGKYDSRVHLLGYSHLREDSRAFNQYLNYIERNYIDKNQ